MRTSSPTAGSAHATFEFGETFLNTDISRLCFLATRYPADPFIAGERGDVIPNSFGLWGRGESLFKVGWHSMQMRMGGGFCGHEGIVAKSTEV